MRYLLIGAALLLGGCATAPQQYADCKPMKSWDHPSMQELVESICTPAPVTSLAIGGQVGAPPASVVVIDAR